MTTKEPIDEDPPFAAADCILIMAALRNYEAHLVQLASLTTPGVRIGGTLLDVVLRRCRILLSRLQKMHSHDDVRERIPDDAARG